METEQLAVEHVMIPILCGYQLKDFWCTVGALMIQVARMEDVTREFNLQMSHLASRGQFGRFPPKGWDMTWYRTRDYPAGQMWKNQPIHAVY